MELWFILAVGAAVTGGLAAFTVKVVAKHHLNSELYIFNSAIGAILISAPLAFFIIGTNDLNWPAITVAFIGGFIAALSQILKPYALRYIDTTIFFPLFKLISPLFAIIIGLTFFNESFTLIEWVGLLFGLLVPLMLITKAENKRQNNLVRGLVLVLIIGTVSAIVAGLNKYATELTDQVLWIMVSASVGILLGSFILTIIRKGFENFISVYRSESNKKLMFASLSRSILISMSFAFMLYAFSSGGTLGVVHTIHSLYILIPIVLSIIFYNEHWNLQKVIAIILSVVALGLLG